MKYNNSLYTFLRSGDSQIYEGHLYHHGISITMAYGIEIRNILFVFGFWKNKNNTLQSGVIYDKYKITLKIYFDVRMCNI